jgi:hypothetical protein
MYFLFYLLMAYSEGVCAEKQSIEPPVDGLGEEGWEDCSPTGLIASSSIYIVLYI